MLRDVITTCALLVSVTGIGVSLAREEMRCYLGLQSAECPPTQVRSVFRGSEPQTNPTTQQSERQSESNHDIKSLTKILNPLPTEAEKSEGDSATSGESSSNTNQTETEQTNQVESVSPVNEISQSQSSSTEPNIPENSPPVEATSTNNSPSSSEEKPFGIPIKVEPFQQSTESNP
ncbi:conserved hypothetical protein [Rippkaea orientalis PCC 8801]|uniref:Uncharacterized protein n=1 Tax=Rippkaea orientalis (strain PCC 8801 / RF-1) TaxID=41431 RepID=B7K5E2_RIPO1|nr:hypothetical protein [Rippkaea orientalis]ACK67968.1 conserved hypothetical protein [Rippkaea orientalis PCC 8801]